MGISQRISTPSSLSRGRWVWNALKVPSGVYCLILTSYMVAFLLHSGCFTPAISSVTESLAASSVLSDSGCAFWQDCNASVADRNAADRAIAR